MEEQMDLFHPASMHINHSERIRFAQLRSRAYHIAVTGLYLDRPLSLVHSCGRWCVYTYVCVCVCGELYWQLPRSHCFLREVKAVTSKETVTSKRKKKRQEIFSRQNN